MPRRPRDTAPVPPANPERPSWFARWFSPRRRLSAWFGGESSPDPEYLHFTPQAFPGLSTEACTILNTPLDECDPEIVRLLLAGLARYIAENLPPELGMTDAGAVFSTLWGRLGALQTAVPPDAAADVPPDAAPDTQLYAPPDAPPDVLLDAPPDARPEPQQDVPPAMEPGPAPAAMNAVAGAPSNPTPAPSHAHPTPPANDAATTAREPTPTITLPAFRSRSLDEAGRPFPRRRRAPIHRRRQPMHHGLRDTPHTRPPQSLPPRRLCYAACAGPP